MKKHNAFLLIAFSVFALLLAAAAPAWSHQTVSDSNTVAAQVVSGGGYRLVADTLSLEPAIEASIPAPGQDSDNRHIGDDSDKKAVTARWNVVGASSGDGYHLEGVSANLVEGTTWQVIGNIGGGSYQLQVGIEDVSLSGSGCCCTYLPFLCK